MPEGKEPKDFAEEAIESLYTGRRTWNCEEYPDPKQVLTGIIDSLVSNLVESAEHRRSKDVEPFDLETFYEDISSEKPDGEVRAEDIEERMRQAVADEPELEFVFDAMLEDMTPRASKNSSKQKIANRCTSYDERFGGAFGRHPQSPRKNHRDDGRHKSQRTYWQTVRPACGGSPP